MVTRDLEEHSKIPTALQKLRSREAKAMGVTLVMLGILLLMALIPIITVTSSVLIHSGIPIVTALLFMSLGTLAILIEQQPRRQCLVKVTEVTLALTAILGAVEMVVLLVDISRVKSLHSSCEIGPYFPMCYQRIMAQKLLVTTFPVVYLMILTGTFLCVALSIILHEFFQTWTPESTGSSPAEASQQLVETGTSPSEDPAPIKGEPQNQTNVILLTTAFGIILLAMPDMVVVRIHYVGVGILWWTFIQCIISGIFSILAEGNPSIPMLRACLSLNIISAIAASMGSLMYLDFSGHLVICITVKCEDPFLFSQHIFPLLLLLFAIILSSVLAAYSRKALRSLSLNKMTLVVNPVAIQETREDPAPAE